MKFKLGEKVRFQHDGVTFIYRNVKCTGSDNSIGIVMGLDQNVNAIMPYFVSISKVFPVFSLAKDYKNSLSKRRYDLKDDRYEI